MLGGCVLCAGRSVGRGVFEVREDPLGGFVKPVAGFAVFCDKDGKALEDLPGVGVGFVVGEFTFTEVVGGGLLDGDGEFFAVFRGEEVAGGGEAEVTGVLGGEDAGDGGEGAVGDALVTGDHGDEARGKAGGFGKVAFAAVKGALDDGEEGVAGVTHVSLLAKNCEKAKFFLFKVFVFCELFACNEMSEEIKIKAEVLEFELEQLRMARRRAKDQALRAKVIAEREVEIEQELEELRGGVAMAG